MRKKEGNMKFKTEIRGYCKADVDKYIENIVHEYELELSKKYERMQEYAVENQKLKDTIQQMGKTSIKDELKEKRIAHAIIAAETLSEQIVLEARRKAKFESENALKEYKKTKHRTSILRNDIISLEHDMCDIMEKFQSEINYLTGKELLSSHNIQSDRKTNMAREKIKLITLP